MNDFEGNTIELSPQWLKDAYEFVERHSAASTAHQISASICVDPDCMGTDHTACGVAQPDQTRAQAPLNAKAKFSAGIIAAQRAGYCITSESELVMLKQTEKARLVFEAQRLYPGQSRLQRLTVKKILHQNGLSEALTPAESRELKSRTQGQPISEIAEELSATH